MKKKFVKIIKYNQMSPLIWYNSHLTELFPYLKEDEEAYFVRDTSGYINFVYKEDAKLVSKDIEKE